MHCKQCGAEINDGAKFCGVCGTPTVAAAASAVGDAIYVEAQPIESQSVEAQFQAAEDAEAAACLQDSLHESIGSLGRAAVISLLYVLFFNGSVRPELTSCPVIFTNCKIFAPLLD